MRITKALIERTNTEAELIVIIKEVQNRFNLAYLNRANPSKFYDSSEYFRLSDTFDTLVKKLVAIDPGFITDYSILEYSY